MLQWELSGAGAGEDSKSPEGLKDTAEAVAEEESDGYVLDMRDGSELDRGSDFEAAAEERRAPVSILPSSGTTRVCAFLCVSFWCAKKLGGCNSAEACCP